MKDLKIGKAHSKQTSKRAVKKALIDGVHRLKNPFITQEEISYHETEKKQDKFYPKLPKWITYKHESKYNVVGTVHARLTLMSFKRRLKNYTNAKKNSST